MAIQDGALLQAQAALYIAQADTVSLHTDDPGTTGDNEVTGGSPAYARKSITWNSDGNGLYHSNLMTFNIPADTELTNLVIWDGSTPFDVADLSEIFSAQSTFDLVLTYTQA